MAPVGQLSNGKKRIDEIPAAPVGQSIWQELSGFIGDALEHPPPELQLSARTLGLPTPPSDCKNDENSLTIRSTFRSEPAESRGPMKQNSGKKQDCTRALTRPARIHPGSGLDDTS